MTGIRVERCMRDSYLSHVCRLNIGSDWGSRIEVYPASQHHAYYDPQFLYMGPLFVGVVRMKESYEARGMRRDHGCM